MIKSIKAKFSWPLLLLIFFPLFCFLVACGGNKDETTSTGNGTTTDLSSITLTLSSSYVSSGSNITATATVLNSNGAAAANTVVTFAALSALVAFDPISATTLTNSSGVATITINAVSSGATSITASATPSSSTVTSSPVGLAVSVSGGGGGGGGSTITLGNITLGSNSISAYGSTSVSVPVYVNSVLATVPMSVTFTSPCVTLGYATLSSPVTTIGGNATSTYTDKGCSATDTITASVTGATNTSSTNIIVAAPTATNIQFVSATPSTIGTSTASSTLLQTSSVVKFRVVNSSNIGVKGQTVNFSVIPDSKPGGLYLSNSSGNTDSDGYISVSLIAGTVPTPVWVVATLASNTNIKSQSNALTITTGLPTQNFFSLSVQTHNIEGLAYDGVTSTLTIIASDRLGNPVPEGTAINFITEGAQISPASCTTTSGTCTVTFKSSAYRPIGETIDYGGSTGVQGAVAALEYDGVTPITINGGPNLYVRNGRVTVLAYTLGEESFVDTTNSGNNIYVLGDTFYDLGNLYIDANENGQWDSGETYISYSSGSSACPATSSDVPSKAGTCDGAWGLNYVRRSQVIILSGSTAQISQNFFSITSSCFAEYEFWLMDGNYNPMPAGTTVAVNSAQTNVNYTYLDPGPPPKTTAAAASVNVAGTPVVDTTHAGGTKVALIINGGSGCIAADTVPKTIISYPFGPVAIDVTTPKGLVTTIPLIIQ
jgi:hypothetical protein